METSGDRSAAKADAEEKATGEAVAKTAPESDLGGGAANPAPEPDTLMLLGTGVLVLVLLYTRRRVRVLAPRAHGSS